MPLPQLHPGLVIGYSYLWRAEHLQGAEEGRKDRPGASIAVRQIVEDKVLIMVFPVTFAFDEKGLAPTEKGRSGYSRPLAG